MIGIDLDTAVVAALFGPDAPLSPRALGGLLDASGVDFVVLGGDVLDPESAVESAFDASVAAAVLSAHTDGVGFVVPADPRVHHPYNLSRRLASLDHVSGGRVGWLVGARSLAEDSVESRVAASVDAVVVARKLWESWPAESIVADPERGVFVESERITFIDHEGVFSVSGPLNVPEPPQLKPPVLWRPHSESELETALGVADVVIVPARHTATDAPALVLEEAQWTGSWSAIVGVPHHAAGIVVRIRGTSDLDTALVAASTELVRVAAAPFRNRIGLPVAETVLDGYRRSAFPSLDRSECKG
ncbi:LLM class flavin-dependent oxidoreductase [Rhodococcus sp. YH1]|uniref:LLM class flavin-dependent oxidoreductase n=1 Tax=Rhodococcus sp. YH1 TaxID=89066 RepID=UPI00138765E0